MTDDLTPTINVAHHQAAVAVTLQYMAGNSGLCPTDREMMYEVADEVARWAPGPGDWSCPVCEEGNCDSNCPMAPLRADRRQEGPRQAKERDDERPAQRKA